MTAYEKVLKLCEEKWKMLTEEEFLRIYNLPFDEYCAESLKMRKANPQKDAAFTHLFVAYQSSYPEKRAEWLNKKEQYLRKIGEWVE